MGQIYNLAKPYIYLWGEAITWPSQILYILKNPDPKTTNIFWKIHSHIQPQAIPPRQKSLFMDYLIKTFSKKIGLWQANYSQSGTFLWKPYFSYRAIWGLFTRDIPSPPSQWRRFGIPSGFFSPPKKDFLCLLMIKHDHKPVATLWHALRFFSPPKYEF